MGFLSRLLGLETRPRELVRDLAEAYRAESEQASCLRQQADRARYPQAATALRRLADIEDRHATWLRDHLISLGGQPPAVEPRTTTGTNQWQRVVAAFHDAQAKRRRLVEQIAHWDPEEPDVVALLRRIEEEDTREHPVYEGLIMRSDPQSID